jgi:glycosyltransferase involved in cell wall biosynthesis
MAYQLLSIILPVYNQSDHIETVITQYMEMLTRIPIHYEVLMVVNGSKDRSLEVCRSLAEQYEAVRVLSSAHAGWGQAIRSGLADAEGDLLCYTNSARTGSQDLLLLLLYAIANPGVVIKANRKIRESIQRRLGSLLYNIECRTLFDLAYWDINGTPKVFPRTFDKLLGLTRNDDLIDVEFNIVCRQQNYPMIEVPILSAVRHGGKSTTSYGSAVRMYLRALQLWRETRQKAL